MLSPYFKRLLRIILFTATSCALWMAGTTAANAQVTCSSTLSNLQIGNVVPWQNGNFTDGNINVTCTNTSTSSYDVAICLSIGTGNADNGTNWDPRKMTSTGASTGNPLYFRLLQSSGGFFGSYYRSPSVNTTMTLGNRARKTVTVPVRAAMVDGQTQLTPGTYTNVFATGHTAMAVAFALTFWSFPPDCSNTAPVANSTVFTFTASATIPDYCEITNTIGNMDFGSADGILDTPKFANTSISVRCTNSTSYKIGLLPSNGFTNGQGVMSATPASSGITDKVPYTLFQNSGATTAWGNLTGNSISDTGIGTAAKTVTVYGRVPGNLNVTPGTYKDTVVVTVTY